MSKECYLIGSGGHAAMVNSILTQNGDKVIGLITKNASIHNSLEGLEVFTDETFLKKTTPDQAILVNGIGSLPFQSSRIEVFSKYKAQGFNFIKVVSKTAILGNDLKLSEGVQIFPGAIINDSVSIGENSLINSGSIIEHDCQLGRDNHVAPGAVVLGSVKTGKRVQVCSNSTVLQNIVIYDDSYVASGAVLKEDLQKNHIIYPGKGLVKEKEIHG